MTGCNDMFGAGEAPSHAASMRQIRSFARREGIALDGLIPDELLRSCGSMPDYLPAALVIDALDAAAERAGRPDLGFAFAAWSNLCGYGPLSLLWDHCGSLAESVAVSRRYMHLEMAALGSEVLDEGPAVALCQFVTVPTRQGGRQFLSATLTLQLRVARRLLGGEWAPLRLELDGPPLADQSLVRRLFRCPIAFGTGRNALIVRHEDMHRCAPHANPAMLALVSDRLDSVGGPVEGLLAQVTRSVRAKLAAGEASLAEVAATMALSPRTLQRRLGEHGTTFAEILMDVRMQVAREYFASRNRHGLEDLARRLGYGDASAASRFLRTAMNMGLRDLAAQGEAALVAA